MAPPFSYVILPINQQIKAWHIPGEEFDGVPTPPLPADADKAKGFSGAVLFYGSGDDGSGNAGRDINPVFPN